MRKVGTLVMLNVPSTGRVHTRLAVLHKTVQFTGWVEDDKHPLGGYFGDVVLYRRINLTKDAIPRWMRERPLYEFTKERPAHDRH